MANTDIAPENGACKGFPVDWWFPMFSGLKKEQLREMRKNAKQAQIICAGCKQKQHCLDYSLKHEPWGIWGGLTEQERAVMRLSKGILLSREGRINFPGVGLRNANGMLQGKS